MGVNRPHPLHCIIYNLKRTILNSHLDPDEEVPLDVDRDPPFMENTPFARRVAVTVTRGRFSGITARGGGGTRPW